MTGFPMLPYWEFDRWIENGRARRIIDLREPWLYEEERIRGSENIPYDEFWDHMGEINYGEMTVFLCERGAKSMVSAGTCGAWDMRWQTLQAEW